MLKLSYSIIGHFQHHCWFILLCSKIDFVFFEIQPYGFEINFRIFFEVSRTIFSRSNWTWPSSMFYDHDHFSHATNCRKCGNFAIICYVDDKWAIPGQFGCFGASLDKVRHSQSWRGHMRSFGEIFPFSWSKQHVHSFFNPTPSGQVVHNRQLALRKKIPH